MAESGGAVVGYSKRAQVLKKDSHLQVQKARKGDNACGNVVHKDWIEDLQNLLRNRIFLKRSRRYCYLVCN